MTFYAHSKDGESCNKWQTLKEHSENVAEKVVKFSKNWCEEWFAKNLGLLHDIGKYQPSFQQKICGKTNIQIEHSNCGAIEFKKYGLQYVGCYCIAGHHSGLPDVGTKSDAEESATLMARLKRKAEDYSAFNSELKLAMPIAFPIINDAENGKKDLAFWTRMMYSCLTDADYLDTELFCNGEIERGVYADFVECKQKLQDYLSKFEADSPIKIERQNLQRQILSHKSENAEIYYMNMPTGSGKTLASIQFALERAVIGNKKHIIYVIPFTTIIEQTAGILKSIFGENTVLEHQSNFDFDSITNETTVEKLRHSAENWDASIIVTTNVQFFESIYGNKSSHLRKLHNIADSIIIFDEVHMLPSKFYQPSLEAIKFLVKQYNCEALFLTATMPDFNVWLDKFECNGLKTLDLIEDKSNFKVFSRCKIENIGEISLDKLIELSIGSQNSLIVVNTKMTARKIYQQLSGKKYHLSTYMTHSDRFKVIEEIKQSLRNNEKFCVVSTSLIEAGIDLDFETVFREMAGLDNILQTAGRCNREGRRKNCKAYAFEFDDKQLQTSNKDFQIKQFFCKQVFENFDDIESTAAINSYFDNLYSFYMFV